MSRAGTSASAAKLDPDKFIRVSVFFCPNRLRAARIFYARCFSVFAQTCGMCFADVAAHCDLGVARSYSSHPAYRSYSSYRARACRRNSAMASEMPRRGQ